MSEHTIAVLPVGDRVVFPGTETTLELKGGAVDRLFSELRKRKARYGVLGVCVGSGQGVALVLENPAATHS